MPFHAAIHAQRDASSFAITPATLSSIYARHSLWFAAIEIIAIIARYFFTIFHFWDADAETLLPPFSPPDARHADTQRRHIIATRHY